jgi:hypothetical protein
MTNLEGVQSQRYPDNGWFNDQIASWEGTRFGYRYLFEVIGDPAHFTETLNSAGDDEIIELYQPKDGHVLKLTVLEQDGNPVEDSAPIILNKDNPTLIVPYKTRYIMDASGSTDSDVSYTCICYGEKPLVREERD